VAVLWSGLVWCGVLVLQAEEGEGVEAGAVPAVGVAGGGVVAVAGAVEDAGDGAGDGGEQAGGLPGAEPGGVFAEGDAAPGERTQWTLFSIVQWPRTYPAMWAGDASRASRLVTMKTAIADFSCLRTQRFPFLTRTVRVTYLSISATWRACGNRFTRACARGRP
jgi:hypothetical protein